MNALLLIVLITGTMHAERCTNDCGQIENRIEYKATRVIKNLEVPPVASDDAPGQDIRSRKSKTRAKAQRTAKQSRLIALRR